MNVTSANARQELAQWYFDTLVVNPLSYAQMNPPSYEAKYSRRHEPLTVNMITGALNGQTRRTRPNRNIDQWQTVQCSYATIPQTTDGRAKAIIVEIDEGGPTVAAQTLVWLIENGIDAFAQLSQSDKHDGAHIWIICADWQPASLLHDIARRLIAHLNLTADAYPQNNDLRLPLMTHLRAPGGPRRFPLLLQSGEIIDTVDAWSALDILRTQLRTVNTSTLINLQEKLPLLPVGGGKTSHAARHKSKVVPSSIKSVIAWYNENHSLRELLGLSDDDNRSTVCCPFHKDKHPSLSIWAISDEKKDVCTCRSTQSSCPAALNAGGQELSKHWDAFDVYCHKNKLTASAAVARLVEEYGLGKKRELEVEEAQPATTQEQMPSALVLHQQATAQDRQRLATELQQASERSGCATVIHATPGLGKTHQAAELARLLHQTGKRVAIIAPTLALAENEWAERLGTIAHVWRSKIDICICHTKEYLQACVRYGFAYRPCTDHSCPYCIQQQKAYGKIIIYQHAHLALCDFAETDVIIIDESPLNALLPECSVTPGTLAGFIKRHPEDAAAPLVRAMLAAFKDLPQTMNDTRGLALIATIEKHLDGWTMADAISRARRSRFNVRNPDPPELIESMTHQFLAPLIDAITDNPSAFSYGKSAQAGKFAYCWHARRIAAPQAYNRLMKPSIIVLDGSANEYVSRKLFEPWPVQFVDIACPLSPLVEVTQVTCTTSTRHVLRDQARIESLGRNVALVCNRLGVTLTGGVTYKAAMDTMQDILGGQWLGYGAQRGCNELADASAIAVVCSPTTPPAALERKALALWPNIDCTWQKHDGKSEYYAIDERLQQINLLSAYEELRQAVYRARPLTATTPMQLIVFSPWNLSEIGITPHRVISGLPHHNSTEATTAAQEYRKRTGENLANACNCNKLAVFNAQVNIEVKSTPLIENGQFVAVQECGGKPPPRQAKEEVLAPVWVAPAPPSPLDELLALIEPMARGISQPRPARLRIQDLVCILGIERHPAFQAGPGQTLELLRSMRLANSIQVPLLGIQSFSQVVTI